jgi:hypothetical protein
LKLPEKPRIFSSISFGRVTTVAFMLKFRISLLGVPSLQLFEAARVRESVAKSSKIYSELTLLPA